MFDRKGTGAKLGLVKLAFFRFMAVIGSFSSMFGSLKMQ
jgi:hypothetical protein